MTDAEYKAAMTADDTPLSRLSTEAVADTRGAVVLAAAVLIGVVAVVMGLGLLLLTWV